MPEGRVIDGKSLASVYLGKTKDGPREWIMAMGGGGGTYDESGRVINVYKYRDRVIRDKRYKLYVETDRSSAKLVDLDEDPAELTNRVDDPSLKDVLAKLEAVEKEFPAEDSAPRYNALPAQKWDVVQKSPGQQTGLKGLPSNAPNSRRKRKNK